MSKEGRDWAKAQTTGDFTLKAVLHTLGDLADARGLVLHGQSTLAAMMECDRKTVSRALKRLEEMRLIRRAQRARQDGSRSTDEIWLKRTPEADNLAVPKEGRTVPPGGQRARRVGAHSPEGGGRESPLTTFDSDSESDSDSSSPQPPEAGGRRASPKFRGDPRAEPVRLASDRPEAPRPGLDAAGAARFERLWAAYPPDGLAYSDRVAAERLFARLDAADQALAVTAADGYRAQLARSAGGKPIRAKALQGWLRQRRFANLRVVPSPVADATPPTRVFVRDGTPDWAAWEAYDRAQGRVPRNASWSAAERAMGWWFASARPPAAA